MIPLKRIRTDVAVHENFRGAKRVEINLALLKKKRDGELEKSSPNKWKSGIWKESKKQLLKESNGKCAYCETPTSVVAFGDVEHFRPKSIYWWLAYSYENYLPSCTLCNQKYKKSFFPIRERKLKPPRVRKNNTDSYLTKKASQITIDPINENEGRPWQEFNDDLATEMALLPNPYVESPDDYFAYEANLQEKKVRIIPIRPELEPITVACEKLFGINRTELEDLRFQQYCLYMTLRHTVSTPNIPQFIVTMSQNRLNELESDSAAYTGMIRHFNKQNLDDLPWDFDIKI